LQPVLDAAKSPDSSVRATAVIVLGFVSPLTPPPFRL
jgi:hypothetical protein